LKANPHLLRHLHASILLNKGVPMAVVTGRLGHDRESTTSDFYSHALPQFDHAAKIIGEVLDGTPAKKLPAKAAASKVIDAEIAAIEPGATRSA
jgi:hypothetical protein